MLNLEQGGWRGTSSRTPLFGSSSFLERDFKLFPTEGGQSGPKDSKRPQPLQNSMVPGLQPFL